jgi:hypothetical protein
MSGKVAKKSLSGYISPVYGAAPSQPFKTSFRTPRDLADAINPAKFHLEQLRGSGWAAARKSHVSIGEGGRL